MARSERIYIRLSEEEKTKLQELADNDHRTISDYVRLMILERLKEEMKMKKNDWLNLMYQDSEGRVYNMTEILGLNTIEWQGDYNLEKYLDIQDLTYQDIQEALDSDWGDIDYSGLYVHPFPLFAVEEVLHKGTVTELTYYRDKDEAIEEAEYYFKQQSKAKGYSGVVRAIEIVNEHGDCEVLWSSK